MEFGKACKVCTFFNIFGPHINIMSDYCHITFKDYQKPLQVTLSLLSKRKTCLDRNPNSSEVKCHIRRQLTNGVWVKLYAKL